ncbi:MAG: VCBS repeat-containing protein, partial [Chitinophagaceae bacterium]|nr:VCBS repeat-containing protein [Chitinophagaceae bacterium]
MFKYCLLLLLFAYSCKEQQEQPNQRLFELVSPSNSHINFINQLSYDDQFNIFTYRNFYNGGGVSTGDINNDGLVDIFFTANMEKNRLYLNKGNFQFEDITDKAGIFRKGKWSTGVAMVDINGDGYLDIYVCNSGHVKGDDKQNELYINNGNNTFSEKAAEYRVNDRGYSTHASFFDFDHDGDLDFFLLNNSFRPIGTFNLQKNERNTRDSLGGHKFFRNDGAYFTDISAAAGIYGSVIGFGLGVTAGDINNDGWDDIYVSNDFFEKDYLYINNKNGTFTESLEQQMQSISYASMGADMADINNDAKPDIFVTEMLPENEARLKTNTNFENWDKYQLNLKYGYYMQFARNMLHLNNGNNSFSEIGRMSGVCATDWSWGALITDLDNDGWKDIFISNGIYQDLTNGDYIQYISNREVMKNILASKDKNKKLIDAMSSHPIPNYVYQNQHDLTFSNKAKEWGLDQPSFSNGTSYADLDNDGDMDLVVNNVNMETFVYRNNSSQLKPENKYLKVILEGEGKNKFGIGTRVTLFYNQTQSYQEQMPMRGFQSSVDYRLNFGLGKTALIDSMLVQWSDGKEARYHNIKPNQTMIVRQSEGKAPAMPKLKMEMAKTIFRNESIMPGLDFIHQENEYTDFDREKLIFNMLSTGGPAVGIADVSGDGRDDIFFGGAKDQCAALYLQLPGGKFKKTNMALWEKDKDSEDTDCIFFDADGDKDLDLYVCSGGNEFSAYSTALANPLYFNDGKGNFVKSPQLLPSDAFMSTSSVDATDWDGDGDLDLFVGTRLQPLAYGLHCKSFILENNGKGFFTDITERVAPELLQGGMVTDGKWFDYDKDNKPDLVITGEYMPICIFHNETGKLKNVTHQAGLDSSNGWWNNIEIADINNDGFP